MKKIPGWYADCPYCRAKEAIRYREGAKSYKCSKCRKQLKVSDLAGKINIKDYLNIRLVKERLFQHALDGYQRQGRGAIVLDLNLWPGVIKTYYLPDTLAQMTIGWPDEEVSRLIQNYYPEAEFIVYTYKEDSYSPDDWHQLWVGPGGKG